MVLQRSVTVDLTCSCGATAKAKPTKAGNLRLPIGWKRVGAETLCKACKSSRYRLRAVTFPVASVEGSEWKEFTAALRVSWGRATELANWAVRQLLLADGDRKASDTKLAPMPTINLYRLWTDTYHDRAAWAGAAQSANAILHSVEAKYRKARFEVVWLIKDRPPRMTYPVPYPVHNAAWKATYQVTTGKDGQVMREPVVTVTLDGRKWIMRLRGGHEMSRQLKAFAQMASGEALRGELAVYRQRSFGSHRRTASEKSPGGGATVKTRIMVKLVAYLPITKHSREVQGVMEVRTGRKALLVGTAPGRESPWLFHCYELKRLIHDYDAKRQRLADDLKFERRPLSGRERDWLDRSATKMNRRIDSFCRMIAHVVVNYAVRQGLAEVVYNDGERRYFERFDWGKLTRYLAEACDNDGLKFTDASGEVVESDEPTVAETTS